MITELRTRLGIELDRLSHDLVSRARRDPSAGSERRADAAAMETERLLQRRVRFLGQLVAGLSSVDPGVIWTDRAGYGSLLRVRDVQTGTEEIYTLTTGDFINLDEGQVSLASPIGHALLGTRVGDHVTVVTPRGQRRYEIMDLVTLPVQMGIVPNDPDEVSLQVA
jgi:transcription elongation factor GreA